MCEAAAAASVWSWCLRGLGRDFSKPWLPPLYDASKGERKSGIKLLDALSGLLVCMLYAINYAGLRVERSRDRVVMDLSIELVILYLTLVRYLSLRHKIRGEDAAA